MRRPAGLLVLVRADGLRTPTRRRAERLEGVVVVVVEAVARVRVAGAVPVDLVLGRRLRRAQLRRGLPLRMVRRLQMWRVQRLPHSLARASNSGQENPRGKRDDVNHPRRSRRRANRVPRPRPRDASKTERFREER